MRRRDRLAAFNERLKLAATTANAFGLAVAGIGVLRPLIDADVDPTWKIVVYIVIAVALHGLAQYIVSQVETDA